jgi:hypothetical protein
MKFVILDQTYHDQLLKLEGEMYWDNGKWKELWEKDAKQKFDDFITDYLINFPRGCFGLIENNELVGTIFLLKISQLKPIPYVNHVVDYLDNNGDIAYVSFFVVNKDENDKYIAEELYQKAENVASSIGCIKLASAS